MAWLTYERVEQIKLLVPVLALAVLTLLGLLYLLSHVANAPAQPLVTARIERFHHYAAKTGGRTLALARLRDGTGVWVRLPRRHDCQLGSEVHLHRQLWSPPYRVALQACAPAERWASGPLLPLTIFGPPGLCGP
jgi:hypothetical protein